MKRKKHIPILVLAALFTIVSNGVPVYEHFCNTENSASLSLVSSTSCDMDEEATPCCTEKKSSQQNSDCCEEKTFFKKFNFDGFTAKFFSVEISDLVNFVTEHISIEIHIPFIHDLFTGLSPPYPDYEIAQHQEHTQPWLQVFIC